MPNGLEESAEILELEKNEESIHYGLIQCNNLVYSRDLSEYMYSRYIIYEYAAKSREYSKLGLQRKTDAEFLKDALHPAKFREKNIFRDLFTRTKTYRLRFAEHFEAGEAFVAKIASQGTTFFPEYTFEIQKFKGRFVDLCKASFDSTDKYRLFELSGTLKDVPIKFVHVLSFLFGIGINSNQATSLTQFIVRFQFFEKFFLYKNRVHLRDSKHKEISK